jgi:hypothetical protein
MDDVGQRRWQEWERSEEAYALAARCARLAVVLQSVRQQLDRLGNVWSAAERARLGKEARAARESYQCMQQCRDTLRRDYTSTWRDLRQMQRGWSADDWERYRMLIEQRLEGAEPRRSHAAELAHAATRSVLAASAEPAREPPLWRAVRLLRAVRSWWARHAPGLTSSGSIGGEDPRQ